MDIMRLIAIKYFNRLTALKYIHQTVLTLRYKHYKQQNRNWVHFRSGVKIDIINHYRQNKYEYTIDCYWHLYMIIKLWTRTYTLNNVKLVPCFFYSIQKHCCTNSLYPPTVLITHQLTHPPFTSAAIKQVHTADQTTRHYNLNTSGLVRVP